MAVIKYEKKDDVFILRVIGGATFSDISAAIKEFFPKVTRHLVWDYTDGDLIDVTSDDFRSVPDTSFRYFTNRSRGRTAFACPKAHVYGMFRMYIAFADIKNMPYEYEVHHSLDEALTWVEEYPYNGVTKNLN